MNWKLFVLAITMMISVQSCRKSPEKDKVLRLNISREPTCFDPRRVFDPSHQMLMSMLFEGLLKLEMDLSVSPAQAKSFEISEDLLTYTFHLGEGMWSDKTAVTADDFVRTYLDLLDPNFPAPHSHLLYDVLGAERAKKGISPLSEVGIRAIDPKTIEIRLEHPNPCFLQILASPHLVPICRAKESIYLDPPFSPHGAFVSNGPFILLRWIPQTEIALTRNKNYKGNYPARINEIRISLISNEMSALHMYGNGYLDLLGTPCSQIPLPYLKKLKESNSLYIQPVSASLFVGFNTQSPPFNHIDFRKALALAIDRQKIIDHITLLDEEPALSPIPSILKKIRSHPSMKDADVAQARIHLEKALREIAPADMEKITLYFWPMEINYLIAQTLQQQWKEHLGLNIEIELIDFKSLLDKVGSATYGMALFAWSANYGDPIALLHRFRNRKDPMNYSLWEDPLFSRLLDESGLEKDPLKRSALLEEAEKRMVDQMPIATLFHWNFSFLVQPDLTGFAIDPLGNIRFDKLSFRNP